MQEKINYEEEVNRLSEFESQAFFKPQAGDYKILFLAEPVPIEKEFEGEKKEQLRLHIEVDKEQYTWDIGKGQTKNSLYGQLILIGKERGGLKETSVQLLVKRSNNKNDYTVVEALPLMKKEEKVDES